MDTYLQDRINVLEASREHLLTSIKVSLFLLPLQPSNKECRDYLEKILKMEDGLDVHDSKRNATQHTLN